MSPRSARTSGSEAPLIGICAGLETAAWGYWRQPAALAAWSYITAVHQAQGIVVLLPPDLASADRIERILEPLDGVMLVGGRDIAPERYDGRAHPRGEQASHERDEFELAITAAALNSNLPILAICRGMQLLNVARGGTLIQHLADDPRRREHMPTPGALEHAGHEVALLPGSVTARAIGNTTISGQSHHHQAIDTLGTRLLASGRCTEDGVIEAIEACDKDFVVGVQWHPEAEPHGPLFAALIRAARARRRHSVPRAVA